MGRGLGEPQWGDAVGSQPGRKKRPCLTGKAPQGLVGWIFRDANLCGEAEVYLNVNISLEKFLMTALKMP